MSWPKRNYIVEYESRVKNELLTKNSKSEEGKEKYFVTFPYPYMNGRLHLGHGYTISKAEFTSRYKKLRGFNVMFPFGFHGTGMPIVASARRLREGDPKLVDNLKKMGIPDEEIPKFKDPYYWINYFPKVAEEDLIKFGISADFSRSFITTDINPWYDSFVRWQFQRLNSGKKLVFGKKPVIYSPKDGQPCADHDRSVGEGVGIKEVVLEKIRLDNTTLQLDATTYVLIDKDKIDGYGVFKYKGDYYIAPKEAIRNIVHQIDAEQVDYQMYDDPDKDEAPSLEYLEHTKDGVFKYYEPETTVISRSDDRCVVCITDQWFIDYGDKTWKNKVKNYVKTGLEYNADDVKNNLIKSVEWLNQWPCSRSQGLGTQLLDTEYVIDSLSDSTIYMAYYTVAHLIESVPIDLLSFDLWEHLFSGGEVPKNIVGTEYEPIIKSMQSSFQYWYPIDLRVSGKDLVSNHINMCVSTHLELWDKEMAPNKIFINGHIMLNGEKMSKSTGNFMTLAEAVDKYGADPTRVALAQAGTSVDDGNFVEKAVSDAILRLYVEMEWIKSTIDWVTNNQETEYSFWDNSFLAELYSQVDKTEAHYENMDYQKVITEGFYNVIGCRDRYKTKVDSGMNKLNKGVLIEYLKVHLTLVQPICPHYVERAVQYSLSKGLELSIDWSFPKPDGKTTWITERYTYVLGKIRSSYQALLKRQKRNPKICDPNNITLKVIVYTLPPFEKYILELIKGSDFNCNTFIPNMMQIAENKRQKGLIAIFTKYAKKCIETYGKEWIDWMLEHNKCEEIYFFKKWIPSNLTDINIHNFEYNEGIQVGKNQVGPMRPEIIID